MNETNAIILSIIILIADAALAMLFGRIAKIKGYPGIAWGCIGFFFPILYLIILLLPKRMIVETKEASINKTNQDDNKIIYSKNKDIFIIFAIVIGALLINLYFLNSDDNRQKYIDCMFNELIPAYLNLEYFYPKKELVDRKIYAADLYEYYEYDLFYESNDFDDSTLKDFVSYYEAHTDETKDDYIVIINSEKDDTYTSYYYDFNNVQAELEDYVMDNVIERYEESVSNNYENDVKSEKIMIKELYDKGFITSPYFKKLYEKNKKLLKNNYVKITARGGKIYDKVYYY